MHSVDNDQVQRLKESSARVAMPSTGIGQSSSTLGPVPCDFDSAQALVGQLAEGRRREVQASVRTALATVHHSDFHRLALVKGLDLLATQGVVVWIAVGRVLVKQVFADGNYEVGIRAGNATRAHAGVVVCSVAGEGARLGLRGRLGWCR